MSAFLSSLAAAADAAAAAEKSYRREAAARIKALEQERAFAFRRLNVLRSVADTMRGAESEEVAVAGAQAALRARLGWSSDSDSRTAVLSRFAPVAKSIFAGLPDDAEASVDDVCEALAAFEGWYEATYSTPFWSLFEQPMAETPVVDF